MDREKMFRLVGVSYEIQENNITFTDRKQNSKIYFPIDKGNLDGQIETFSIDFFMSNPHLQRELTDRLNGTQH